MLVLVFIVMPLAELYVIAQVADPLGWLNTFALLLVISIFGAWMVRWQGLSVLGRIQVKLAAGQTPTTELYNGGLVLVAGALLLTPGFITDAFGFILLLPPTRAAIRLWIQRIVKQKMAAGQIITFGTGGFGERVSGTWIDVDSQDWIEGDIDDSPDSDEDGFEPPQLPRA
ncbi:MAG: FxsA family protein [Acidimicrobiales bacterium]